MFLIRRSAAHLYLAIHLLSVFVHSLDIVESNGDFTHEIIQTQFVNTMNTSEILIALAGTYSLLNTSSFYRGASVPDASYGEAPTGILIYSAAGYMSATITATEPEYRPGNLTFPFLADQTDADWALVGKHSIGYAGPLNINTALRATKTEGQVFHGPLTVANVPSMVNASHKRNYTVVEQDDVTYLRIGSERAGGYTGELWWKKLV